MRRLFIAIKIQPDAQFLKEFRSLKTSLQFESIKWVEEHNIHITLKFLGETGETKIPMITQIMEEIVNETPRFSFLLKDLGIFGSVYDPKVIWIGIEPATLLVSSMKLIRERLTSIGFTPDRQNLVPHLTLGRIKSLRDKKKFQQIIEQYRSIASQEIQADNYILYESRLKKEGPEYLALQYFQLEK